MNFVKLEPGQNIYTNPKLHSYPNYETNELDVSTNNIKGVSLIKNNLHQMYTLDEDLLSFIQSLSSNRHQISQIPTELCQSIDHVLMNVTDFGL